MKKITFLSLLLLACVTLCGAPKIILKLDDLGVTENKCSCKLTLDYLIKKNIKASYGIIADRLDNTAKATLQPYLDAKNKKGENMVEMWHHGLDHKRPEFRETSYEYQKEHFDRATQIICSALGIKLHTFGAPFNAVDSVTYRVIAGDPDFKVVFFAKPEYRYSKKITYLNNRVSIEQGTGNILFDQFIKDYEQKKGNYNDYIVLQAHPNKWTKTELDELDKIIEYLQNEGCEFVLPYEYVNSITK